MIWLLFIISVVFTVFVIGSIFAADSSSGIYPPPQVQPNRLELYDEMSASLQRMLAADERKRQAINRLRQVNDDWERL